MALTKLESGVDDAVMQASPRFATIANRILGAIMLGLALFCAVRWYYYVDRFSVDVLFFDQWDFYHILFNDSDWWQRFRIQLGPHRQGLGGIVGPMFAEWMHWNVRVQCFLISAFLTFASIGFLFLKRAIAKRWGPLDGVIVVVCHSLLQCELFAVTPNLSHGAMPIFLLALFCLALTFHNTAVRYGCLVGLNFLIIHTGFGIFCGVLLPFYFGLEIVRTSVAKQARPVLLAIVFGVLSILSLGVFFYDYIPIAYPPNFVFPVEGWYFKYAKYISLMLGNVFGLGLSNGSIAVGAIVLVLSIALSIKLTVDLLVSSFRGNPHDSADSRKAIVLFLILFTLGFCLNTAIGRIGFGYTGARSGRYIPYILPAILGLFIYLSTLDKTKLKWMTTLPLVVGLLFGSVPLQKHNFYEMKLFAEGKIRWVEAYLQTKDVDEANRIANFVIYPHSKDRIEGKLKFLEQNNLSFFHQSDR